ncbi:Pentatricopeptide repeat-containing protein [Arachis hypogaea]|nr:Pentatricopeptide repeat-containing protein [Arachis hypogaea]
MSLYSINDVMLKGHAHQILMSSSICGVRPQETRTSNSCSFSLFPEKSQINHVAAQSISTTILSSSTIMGKHNHYVISLACQSMNMRLLVPKPKALLPKVKSTMGSMTWPSGFLLGFLVCNSNSKPTNSDESEDDGNERDEFNDNVSSARSVFDNSTKNEDLMMYSAMISAYAKANCINEAFDIFAQMIGCGIKPNEITMVCLLSLCVKSGSLEMGKWIHSYLDKQGTKADMVLKTSLVDMYSKCGDIDTADGLFVEANDRDISMWNAMISGFAMHGHVLHACSHAGLVQEGKRLFCRMVNEFSLVPKIEHYGCMVDLLGRAGSLEKAQELIKDMPMRPNSAVLGSFLAACKVHKNVNLAEWAAKQFLSLESKKCGYNVLVSNIYAASNRWENVADIKRAIKDAEIHKEPGFNSIEVHGTIHEFVTGDREHPETPKIYEMIAEMREKLEHAGYTPNVSVVLKNIDMEEKESVVNYHSEKLAMAYGLISTGPRIQLRILKDLLTSTAESKIFHITEMHDKIITINRKSLEIEYVNSSMKLNNSRQNRICKFFYET